MEDEWDVMDEWEAIVARKRVICQAILNGARTPEAIQTVADSIGNSDYGSDPIVLRAVSDYWDSPE